MVKPYDTVMDYIFTKDSIDSVDKSVLLLKLTVIISIIWDMVN